MARVNNLSDFLADVADAIRTKKETTEQIPAANFDTEISNITTGVMTKEEYDRCENIADIILANTEPYIALKYIKGTGTQYIDTLFTPDKNTKIVLGISDVGGTINDEGGIVGAYTSWSTNSFLLYEASGIRWTYNDEIILTTDITSYHDIEIYRKSCIIDGTVISSDTTDINTNINTSLTIFKGGSKLSKMKLYYCKIYNGKDLIMDFIPAKDKESNEIGLWDKIKNKFYGNSGIGIFLSGGVA